MRQFSVLSRWGWTFLVVVTLGFAGCDGDDGATGAAGQPGAAGTPGAAGPPGPPGPGASTTPLESCGVCHDDGSINSAPAAHALGPIESVSNVSFVVNNADLDVTFDLAADGVPAEDYDSMQRGYRTDGLTRTDVCGAPGFGQPGFGAPCDPALITLTNNGGGNYTIKVLGGAAAAATDHRYLFRVGAGSDRQTRVYFWGDSPATPIAIEPAAVSAEACTACHGPERLSSVHGGYYAAADGVETCLTCHGVDGVASLATVAHGYHSGIESWEDPVESIEPHVTYPTYMTNCSVCHSETAELAAANGMLVSGTGCFGCHGSMVNSSWNFPVGTDFHLTIPDPATADCQLCHTPAVGYPEDPLDPPGLFLARATVAEFHNGATTGRGGIIFDGVDTSVTEGAKFDWQITGVVDDGVDLAISWIASYDGVGVDPCNATAAAGAPIFFGYDFDGDGLEDDNLSMLRSYAQGDDFIIGMSTSAPGQALNVGVSNDNTTCAGGIATTTIPVDTVDAERGVVALQGKPRVVSVLDPAATMSVRAVTPTYEWMVGDGAPPVMARRAIVDTGLCLDCHVGSLYQHGGNRVDNVDMCILCHNSASNEQNVRARMGVDASEAYDGNVGETYEMKTMLHRIHAARQEGQPVYAIYRGRGVYAFAPDVSDVPNWDVISTEGCTATEIADGKRRVFGSADDGSDICEVHNFHSATYPRALNDCAACHVAGAADLQPDQTKAMATTVEAGSEVWEDQLDDVLQGAATTACITCHAGSAAKGHAYQNSWVPQEFPEGRQTIIDAP